MLINYLDTVLAIIFIILYFYINIGWKLIENHKKKEKITNQDIIKSRYYMDKTG